MKKIIYSVMALFIGQVTQAQVNFGSHFYGGDAFKFSQIDLPVGTARAQGMGGAFTALGGDASSIYTNPAGLGFYNKSEFSASLGINNSDINSSYLGNAGVARNTYNNSTNLASLSLVFGNRVSNSRKKSSSFGIGFNNLKNYNSTYEFEGSNNVSSMQDYFAQFSNYTGPTVADLQSEFDKTTYTADTPEAMYYYAYLIEPKEDGNGYNVGETALPVDQSGRVSESGNLNQVTFAYGANFDDKTYIGASLGFQTLNYKLKTDFTEGFADGSFIENYTYTDELQVSGAGINLNIGGIIRASKDLTLGASLTTPTFLSVNETLYSSISDLSISDPSIEYNSRLSVIPNDFTYSISSPFKGQVGAAYFLPGKLGVISADAEYVGYAGMNVKDIYNDDFKTVQKNGITSEYKNVVNLKAGTELRFGNARVRGGVNYQADPYEDTTIDRSKLVYNAGVGYRSQNFFADLAYSGFSSKFSYTPYTLNNSQDYSSALQTQKLNSFRISVGKFF